MQLVAELGTRLLVVLGMRLLVVLGMQPGSPVAALGVQRDAALIVVEFGGMHSAADNIQQQLSPREWVASERVGEKDLEVYTVKLGDFQRGKLKLNIFLY